MLVEYIKSTQQNQGHILRIKYSQLLLLNMLPHYRNFCDYCTKSMKHQTWYICSVCKSYTRSNYKSVLGHMRIHKFDPNLSLKCGINSCPEEYTVDESFRSHVYWKHRELLYTRVSERRGRSQKMKLKRIQMRLT